MLGKKVMVLDYVVPTPKGTTWGKIFYFMMLSESCLHIWRALDYPVFFFFLLRSWWNLCECWLHS